jgi:hypothetical protein
MGISKLYIENRKTFDIHRDTDASSVTNLLSMADSRPCEWLYPPIGKAWLPNCSNRVSARGLGCEVRDSSSAPGVTCEIRDSSGATGIALEIRESSSTTGITCTKSIGLPAQRVSRVKFVNLRPRQRYLAAVGVMVPISASLGLEHREHGHNLQAQSFDHLTEHMIVEEPQSARHHLHCDVPIAQVIRRLGERDGIIAHGFEKRFLDRNDFDISAILGPHAVAAPQQSTSLNDQSGGIAAIEPQQQTAFAARLEGQFDRVGGRFRAAHRNRRVAFRVVAGHVALSVMAGHVALPVAGGVALPAMAANSLKTPPNFAPQ